MSLVPLLFVLIHYFGATGAAINWVILHIGYIVIAPHIMHRRLLKTEKWAWYLYDVIIPGGGIFAVGLAAHFLFRLDGYSLLWQIVLLGAVWFFATLVGVALAPNVRRLIRLQWSGVRGILNVRKERI